LTRYESFDRHHLDEVIGLCKAEGWLSYTKDSQTAWRALTAPGSHTVVAVESEEVVGFVQVQSDGVLQAHLSLLCVAKEHRRRGVGRRLVRGAFARCGAKRIDLVSMEDADAFYRSFNHKQGVGYRLYPDVDP
jgi:ribosomal protein S18 acetylase RimI-like enzyme